MSKLRNVEIGPCACRETRHKHNREHQHCQPQPSMTVLGRNLHLATCLLKECTCINYPRNFQPLGTQVTLRMNSTTPRTCGLFISVAPRPSRRSTDCPHSLTNALPIFPIPVVCFVISSQNFWCVRVRCKFAVSQCQATQNQCANLERNNGYFAPNGRGAALFLRPKKRSVAWQVEPFGMRQGPSLVWALGVFGGTRPL